MVCLRSLAVVAVACVLVGCLGPSFRSENPWSYCTAYANGPEGELVKFYTPVFRTGKNISGTGGDNEQWEAFVKENILNHKDYSPHHIHDGDGACWPGESGEARLAEDRDEYMARGEMFEKAAREHGYETQKYRVVDVAFTPRKCRNAYNCNESSDDGMWGTLGVLAGAAVLAESGDLANAQRVIGAVAAGGDAGDAMGTLNDAVATGTTGANATAAVQVPKGNADSCISFTTLADSPDLRELVGASAGDEERYVGVYNTCDYAVTFAYCIAGRDTYAGSYQRPVSPCHDAYTMDIENLRPIRNLPPAGTWERHVGFYFDYVPEKGLVSRACRTELGEELGKRIADRTPSTFRCK